MPRSPGLRSRRKGIPFSTESYPASHVLETGPFLNQSKHMQANLKLSSHVKPNIWRKEEYNLFNLKLNLL
jgi:hypothetical protein